MREQAVTNHKRTKDKELESIIDSSPQNQTLKQEKQLNDRNHHIPIKIILNVNGLNSTIKRHHLPNWIKKKDSIICCV
jgi:hypothetical protein